MATPLYQSIAEDMSKRIRSGEFAAGDRLMSVGEFCEHYDVSLATAHRSIGTLASQGLVKTIPRKGVYVAGVPSPPPVEEAKQVERIILVESVIQRKRTRSTGVRAFSQGIVDGVVAASREHQIPLQFEYIPVYSSAGPKVYFAPKAGDGIIAVGGGVSVALMSHLATPNVPSVLVDAALPNAHCVLTDNYHGMERIVSHLYDQGHRHIAAAVCFATPVANATNENERRDAACHHAQLKGMRVSTVDTGEWEDLFALLKGADRPTAVVFTRDLPAVQFMNLATQRGYRVPEDISVTGFDDWAREVETLAQLTTVHVDVTELGREAVDMILDPPRHQSEMSIWRRVKPQLKLRSSVVKIQGK